MGVGMLVFGIVGRVDLVGRVEVGALVEVVLAGGASYRRVGEKGKSGESARRRGVLRSVLGRIWSVALHLGLSMTAMNL